MEYALYLRSRCATRLVGAGAGGHTFAREVRSLESSDSAVSAASLFCSTSASSSATDGPKPPEAASAMELNAALKSRRAAGFAGAVRAAGDIDSVGRTGDEPAELRCVGELLEGFASCSAVGDEACSRRC